MINYSTSPCSILVPLAVVLVLASVARADVQEIIGEERSYMKKKLIDISHKYVPDLPAYDSKKGLGKFIKLKTSIKLGDLYNFSIFKLTTHSGTHVDAPGHFNETLFELGYDVVSLHLRTLNGSVSAMDFSYYFVIFHSS